MIERKVHKIDASDKIAGRLASRIAILLTGKHKTSFERHLDCGDFVEITNVKAIKFSGNKASTKVYYRHSQYPGGLHKTAVKDLLKTNPAAVLRKTVYNMLPKNRLRPKMLKRLNIS